MMNPLFFLIGAVLAAYPKAFLFVLSIWICRIGKWLFDR